MKVEKTERNTYRVTFKHGELEVNLIPANGLLPMSAPCAAQFDGKLIYLHDNVGVTALQLKNCPPVPRICFDNREHQFWAGYSGGFEPRNTVVNDIKVTQTPDERQVSLSFYYIANFVKVTESWTFSESDDSFITWDTRFTFENLNKFALIKYMAFFACYHEPGVNYYWANNDELLECADLLSGFLNEERRQREHECCAAFQDIVKSWGIKDATRASVLYGEPMLMSEKREWYGNGQHVFFVEPDKCLCIVSAMRQARDYMLAPSNRDLAPQESFSARVRHIIADIGGKQDLQRRWDAFILDIAKG